jgi:histidinol-phosphate phosphatase family protein
MNQYDVVILAGGFGTRMSKRFPDVPKALIPVCGSSMLEHQINECKKYGYKNILILVHFDYEKIIQFIGNGSKYDVNISYHIEKIPLGTGGALFEVKQDLAQSFLVLYADVFIDVNINKFKNFHKLNNSDISIVVHPNNHPYDSDLVEIDGLNRVKSFKPHPHNKDDLVGNQVNAAMYFFEKKIFDNYQPDLLKFDIAQDLFPDLLKLGKNIYGYNTVEYLKDMGTPDRLDMVEKELKNGIVKSRSDTTNRLAIFIDRDGTINKEKGFINSPNLIELLPGASSAIADINKSIYLSICVTNQPVIARGDCTLDELKKIHIKLEKLLGQEGAYLDRLYFCPHHPDRGYKNEIKELKIICNCRKPNTGLIDKAVSELNIDLMNSWMIGDRTADIRLAKNLNLFSALVLTGDAGKDFKHKARPDFIANDLRHAVNFILSSFASKKYEIEKIVDNLKSRRFILLGGLSRAGKTSLAGILKNFLRQNSKNTHIVELDRFLKPDRIIDDKFRENYNFDMVVELINCFLKNEEFRYTDYGYNHKDNQIIEYDNVLFQKDDFVIIDGNFSFDIAEIVHDSCLKIYVDIDEEIRFERFIEKYSASSHKLNIDEINILWQKRAKVEDVMIKENKANSDIIFNWIS